MARTASIGWLLGALLSPGLCVAQPKLQWEPRSDWINVRTSQPAALGDGVADDTVPLQAALDKLSDKPGEPTTLYFPPGKYRITRTLHLKQRDGVALIGHGGATRLVWDGPTAQNDESRMFWSDGAPRSRYVGLTWDGNGKAYVGFDHDSKGYFETEIDHQYESFVNFTGSGIRIGHEQVQATAETTYANCIFSNCANGISLLQFNDYNHTLTGCEFRDCEYGIRAAAGPNFYVRDSHFEHSRVVDVRVQGEHSISVRRCTSVGSQKFIDESTIAPLTVQDCQIDSWRNLEGAITLGSGPVLLFDCVFSRPPGRRPPITLSEHQHLIVSNNRSGDTDGLIKRPGSASVTEVPDGRLGRSLSSPYQSFLQRTSRVTGRVFDARREFGARGDGRSDDTAAIQSAVEAAKRYGRNAVAYLPSGDYRVTRTIEMTGHDYSLAGCGIHSRLTWAGPEGGIVVSVHDPQNLTIEDVDLSRGGAQQDAVDILQTGSEHPGRMHYGRVWVFGMYSKQAWSRGLQCRDLAKGTVVTADHFNGNIYLTNCARADILINSSFEGSVTVEGRGVERNGFLGFMTRLATINRAGLFIRNSQDVVMSDYYVESAERLMDFAGNPGDVPGSVTIQMAKSHCAQNPVIDIRNYSGRLTFGPTMLYPGGINPAVIHQEGANLCQLIWMACQAYQVAPRFELAPAASLALIENTGRGGEKNLIPEGAMVGAAGALDDLRRLGGWDLKLNHPGVRPNGGAQDH